MSDCKRVNATIFLWDICRRPIYKGKGRYDYSKEPEVFYLWGFNKDNKRVCVKVRGYSPLYYIYHPNKQLLQDLYETISCSRSEMFEGVNNIRMVSRHTTNGGLDKKALLQMRINNPEIAKKLSSFCEAGLFISGGRKEKYEFCEGFVSPDTKFICEANINLGRWVKLSGNLVYEYVDESGVKRGYGKVETIADYEIECDWETLDISPVDSEVQFPAGATDPTILSFDIETYSDRHERVPDADVDCHVAYMVSCVVRKYKDIKNTRRIGILIGDCDDITSWGDVEGREEGEDCKIEIRRVASEEELVDELNGVIIETDPDMILGYNIFSYDYPYLITRMKRLFKTWRECGRFVEEKRNFLRGQGEFRTSVIPGSGGRLVIDVYGEMRDIKLKDFKLNTVSKYLIDKEKHDLPAKEMFVIYEKLEQTRKALLEAVGADVDTKVIRPLLKDLERTSPEILSREEVTSALQEYDLAVKDYTRVMAYCFNDSDITLEIFEARDKWDGFCSIADVTYTRIQDSHISGAQVRSVNLLYKYATKTRVTITLPREELPTRYVGGYVFKPIPGFWEIVAILDFNSLYPSLIKMYNMCYTTYVPKHMHGSVRDEDVFKIEIDEKGVKETIMFWRPHVRKGIVPAIMRDLINFRKQIRAQQKKYPKTSVKWITLEMSQLAAKLAANGFYGILAMAKGHIAHMNIARAITGGGRNWIQEVSRYCEQEKGYKTVYGDTDSVMVDMSEKFSGNPLAAFEEAIVLEKEINDKIFGDYEEGLVMECEKLTKFLPLTKKKYYTIMYKGIDDLRKAKSLKDVFKMDPKDPTKFLLYGRGGPTLRRETPALLCRYYEDILQLLFSGGKGRDAFKIITDMMEGIVEGKFPPSDFEIVNKISMKEYKNESCAMYIMYKRLSAEGKDVRPGDRKRYYICKHPDDGKRDVKLGEKLYIVEEYEEYLGTPKELKIDYQYYLEKKFVNVLDQLFENAFRKDIQRWNEHNIWFSPPCKSPDDEKKRKTILKPISMVVEMIKYGQDLSDLHKYLSENDL